MELTKKETELIRKFFDKELSESEQVELETLEKSSADFRDELLTQRAIISSLKAQEKARRIEAVKKLVSASKIDISDDSELDEIETPVIPIQEKPDMQVSKSGFSIIYKVAAAVILLIAASVVLFNQLAGPSPAELYLSYYEPYDASVSTRSYTDDEEANPLAYYQKGDYESAVISLKKAIGKPGASQFLRVCLGIALLETGTEAEAIAVFQEIYEESPNDFSGQHAEWYLALIQLKTNPAKAKEQFQKIADQGGVYEREAKEVLDKL